MRKSAIALAISSTLFITACSENQPANTQVAQQSSSTVASEEVQEQNPLLTASILQYQAPDFTQIKDEHFLPAFAQGMAEQIKEIDAIANNSEVATFENTLVAMENSGELLTRVSRIFFNLAGSDSNPERRDIQKEMAPKLAGHSDNIRLNEKLFGRIEGLYNTRNDLKLDNESVRLIEVTYKKFVRAGAKLTEDQKTAIRALNEEHSTLTTQFGQNLLKETKNIQVIVESVEELDGLSASQIKSAQNAATRAGHEGKYALSITNTTRQPILASLNNREIRQRVWQASANRAQSGETDNRPIVARLANLRAEKADLLGYDSWASYGLEAQMAKTPQAVFDMFGSMVPAVVDKAEKEAQAIQEMIEFKGGDFKLEPWDWAD